MLNKYRNISSKYRYDFMKRYLRVTLIWVKALKKQKVKKVYVYNGNTFSEKKLSFLDFGNNMGQYTLTRKLYAKPEKFFKFKYNC